MDSKIQRYRSSGCEGCWRIPSRHVALADQVSQENIMVPGNESNLNPVCNPRNCWDEMYWTSKTSFWGPRINLNVLLACLKKIYKYKWMSFIYINLNKLEGVIQTCYSWINQLSYFLSVYIANPNCFTIRTRDYKTMIYS